MILLHVFVFVILLESEYSKNRLKYTSFSVEKYIELYARNRFHLCFLVQVPIPAGNVYAINEALSADGAADDYETCLKHLVKTKTLDQSESTGFPKFDCMLIGMGPDGHIASLFPGHPLVQVNDRWVASIKDSPKPPPERISFTLPVINSSANIALVVPGAGKAGAVYSALSDVTNSEVLPVQLVAPEGDLTWFLDKDAASKL